MLYKQLQSGKKSLLPAKINNFLTTTLMNIGDIYQQLELQDSALIYGNEAYELAVKVNDENLGPILTLLGNIYFKQENYTLSEGKYRASIPHSLSADNKYAEADAFYGLATIFKKYKQVDSSLVYAKASLKFAIGGTYTEGIVSADLLISEAYELKKQPDSAYYYFKTSVMTRDSMFNTDIFRQIQAMKLVEQARQKDRADAQEKAKKDRMKSMQMMGIVIFLIALFGMFTIWSKRNIKHKALKYLGLLGLLLTFEFISYFLHPFIVHSTHDTPVLSVLCLVVVGFLLLPFHHRLGVWVEKRMAHIKNHKGETPADITTVKVEKKGSNKPGDIVKSRRSRRKKTNVSHKQNITNDAIILNENSEPG